MTVEELPDLNPPDFGGIEDPDRPMLSFEWEQEAPQRVAAHSHPRAHIIHPERGAIWVRTPDGAWVVPAPQAIWVPPRVHHEVTTHGPVAARVLFVDEAFSGALPTRSGAVVVSALLEQLLRRSVELGNDYPPDGPAARLAQVALDELAALEVAPFLLPIAREPRLAKVLQCLIDQPGVPVGFDQVAEEAGTSPRTLARLFRSELGMTYTQWRTRLVLVKAIDRLSRGDQVSKIAFDLGYSSTSSFVYMFRSNLGVSPGCYLAR